MATDQEILDGLVQKANELAEKATKSQIRANEFAEDCGLPAPFTNISSSQPATTGGKLPIRSDQFGNCTTPSSATREYLDMRGQRMGAASLDDVYNALVAGGFTFSSSSKNVAIGGLKVALGKDRGIRRLPNGTYGLWAWYPNARRDDEKGESDAKGGGDDAKEKAEEKPDAKSEKGK